MSEEIEIDDVEDALRRADELSDLTGRKKADIIADLLDDGKLNRSAGSDADEKKDILDIAQEKAEKLKSLLTTLIPIILLLGGVGAEGLGVLDITGWGEDSVWDNEDDGPHIPPVKWGCMNPDALNFDPNADEDDGSCEFETQGPSCEYAWVWEDNSHTREEGESTTIVVDQDFIDDNSCNHDIRGYFVAFLHKDGNMYADEQINSGPFHHSYSVYHEFQDLESGNYRIEVEYFSEEGTDYPSPHQPYFTVEEPVCISSTEMETPLLSADGNDLIVDLTFSEVEGCGQDIEIRIEVWDADELHDSMDYGIVHEGVFWISADDDTTMRVQGKAELSDLPDGDYWTIKAQYRHSNADDHPFESELAQSNSIVIDEIEDCQDDDEDGICNEDEIAGCTDENAYNYDSEATDDDGSCSCEINLWEINIESNATHAWVVYDLDCGYNNNDYDGYNVSVQFLVYEVNGTNSGPNATGPLNWTTQLHFIEGWEGDVEYMILGNFTQNNTTHYDFYFYAIWEDSEGDGQLIERKWLNRELDP